jgi:hypothetical protein
MARHYQEYRSRGASIAAIVVDQPEQNAAMVEKLVLPFPVLADPDGALAIRPMGVWNEESKLAQPAMVVLKPDGQEVYRYVGVDFADRPNDDDVLAALDGLGLPALDGATPPLPTLPPRPSERAIDVHDLGPYMRGVRFAAMALAERARDPFDRGEAERTATMAERFLAALGETQRLAGRSATSSPY